MRPSFCKVREEGLFYCIAPSVPSPPPMPLGANNKLAECAEGSAVKGVGLTSLQDVFVYFLARFVIELSNRFDFLSLIFGCGLQMRFSGTPSRH